MIPAISKIYYPGWQSSQAWRDRKRAYAVEGLRIDLLKMPEPGKNMKRWSESLVVLEFSLTNSPECGLVG